MNFVKKFAENDANNEFRGQNVELHYYFKFIGTICDLMKKNQTQKKERERESNMAYWCKHAYKNLIGA